MASKYFGGVSAGSDYSQNFINIDKLLDVFVKTEESVGHKPTFEQDIPMSSKNDPEPEVKYKKKETEKDSCSCGKTCGGNCSCHNNDKKFHLGQFEQEEDEYDDDDPYICEWCSALGYGSKYIPELCDSCNKCESCQEYIDEECGGCGYSVFEDGRYYREKISETELFTEDELDKFASINLNQENGKTYDRCVFSVTNM